MKLVYCLNCGAVYVDTTVRCSNQGCQPDPSWDNKSLKSLNLDSLEESKEEQNANGQQADTFYEVYGGSD